MCVYTVSLQSEYEQLNYARQLKERLEAFTQDFLPHMKEEEEVQYSRTTAWHSAHSDSVGHI